MQDVYLVTKRDTAHPGNDVLIEVFTDEQALRAFLAKHVGWSPSGLTSGVYEPSFSEKFKIQKMKANAGLIADSTEVQPIQEVGGTVQEEPIEMPDLCITVSSESDWDKTYGISVDKDGGIHACTCPDFEFRGDRGACKHMLSAAYALVPGVFGVPRFQIGREFYNDPWNRAKQQGNPLAGSVPHPMAGSLHWGIGRGR